MLLGICPRRLHGWRSRSWLILGNGLGIKAFLPSGLAAKPTENKWDKEHKEEGFDPHYLHSPICDIQ